MLNYNHCLRPIFTENIVKTLKRGESLNIYGAKGQGRKRLLKDLQNCQFDDMQVLFINMRIFACSYQGFLEAFAEEISYVGDTVPKLGDLVNELERNNGDKKTVILLHNFDSLFDNDKLHENYGIRFFISLNAITNRQNMALVCVTEKQHKSYMVYAKEVVDHGSWLDLKPKRLPDLNMEEIQTELKRHFPALYMDELDQIRNKISAHKCPYHLLMYFMDRLNNHEDMDVTFTERLGKWRKEFDEEYPILDGPTVDNWMRKLSNWLRTLRIGNIFSEFKAILNIIFSDYILYFIKRFFDFIESIFGKKK